MLHRFIYFQKGFKMKYLLISAAIMAVSMSANATMEASWDENELTAQHQQIACPTYIYIKNSHDALEQKVWAHEIAHHSDSAVDNGQCVYE